MKCLPGSLAASAALCLLAACGGGGASSSAPTATPAAIHAGNQTTVARATVNGGLALGDSNTLQTSDRRTAQSATQQATGGSLRAIDAALQASLGHLFEQRRAAQSASVHASAANSVTQPCGVSGSVVVTANDVDNSQAVSGGDTLTLAFSQCQDTAGGTLNGAMVFTIGSVVSATATNMQFTGSLAFEQVQVALGQTATSINGGVTVSVHETATSSQITMSVDTGGLSVSATAPAHNDTITYLPGMQVALSDNGTVSTVSLDGSFNASSVGGQVTVSTSQPLTQLATDAYPSSGQVTVTGAAQSALRITILDATQMRLELDANGDGSFEANTTVPWGTLLPA